MFHRPGRAQIVGILGLLAIALTVAPLQAHRNGDRWESSDVLISETLPATQSTVIDVEVADADIEFISGKGGNVVVKVKVWASREDMDWAVDVFERMKFQVDTSPNTISISAVDPRISNSEWRRHHGYSVLVTITHPESINLDVKTGDGDVSVGDVNGRVSLRTSDGDVRLDNIRGPHLAVHSSDGDIAVESIRCESATLRTSDGDVRVLSLEGPLEISTSDGDIFVQLDKPGDISLKSSDGDIIMETSSSLKADINFRGGKVTISGDFELHGTLAEDEVRGTLNGGGIEIEAMTRDGDIVLRG